MPRTSAAATLCVAPATPATTPAAPTPGANSIFSQHNISDGLLASPS